jgi:hypothetical protein
MDSIRLVLGIRIFGLWCALHGTVRPSVGQRLVRRSQRHTTFGLPVKLCQFTLWPISNDHSSPFKQFLLSRLREL